MLCTCVCVSHVFGRDLKLENLLFVGADNQQPDADQVLSKHKVLPAGPLRLVIGDAGSGSWAGLIEPPKVRRGGKVLLLWRLSVYDASQPNERARVS